MNWPARLAWMPFVLAAGCVEPSSPASPPEATPAPAPAPAAADAFLARLVGSWSIERTIRGQTVHNDLDVEPVLGGQFVRLHMQERGPAQPGRTLYEALVLVGFDPAKQHYVAHWCDSWGPGFASVGFGTREGDRLPLVFAYDDGPFYNTFVFDPAADAWTFTMENSAPGGGRKLFGIDRVTRRR